MKFSEDDHFIQFLQTHQPQPPLASADRETALMALIDACPQQSSRKSRSRGKALWLVPTAIAAGMTILWSQYKSFAPIPEFAQEPDFTTFVSNGSTGAALPADEGLGVFLETSWSNVIEPNRYASYAGIKPYGYAEMFVETEP